MFFSNSVGGFNLLTISFSKMKEDFHAFEKKHPNAVRAGQIALVFFAALTVVGIPLAAWGAYAIYTSDQRKKYGKIFEECVGDEETDIESLDFCEVEKGREDEIIENTNAEIAIKELENNPGQRVGDAVVSSVMEALVQTHPEVDYVDHRSFENKGSEAFIEGIKEKLDEKDKRFLVVTMIRKLKFDPTTQSHHLVVVGFDKQRKEMFYFDPKGNDLTRENRIIKGFDVAPSKIFNDANFPGYTIKSNEKVLQPFVNHHICGLLGPKFAIEMVKQLKEGSILPYPVFYYEDSKENEKKLRNELALLIRSVNQYEYTDL